jgi:polysaccharide chain length determinant protein (PEP-CTERM system associated)
MSAAPAAAITHVWKKPKRQPLSILRMIWKQRFLVLIVWAALAAVSGIVVLKLPAVYRAETVILVESQRIPERFVESTVNSDLKDRLAQLGQQILSYTRLLGIVEKFDLYKEERKSKTQEEIIEMMKADVSIQLEEGWASRNRGEVRPSAFRISYQGRNPEIVALVANQLGNFFIDENLRAREVQAVGTSEFLGTQLAEAKKRLEEQEARMSQFKLQHNGELPEQETSLIAAVGQSQLRLQGALDALARAESSKSTLEASLASARQSEEAFDKLFDKAVVQPAGTPAADAAPDNAAAVQRRLDQARAIWGENHPEIRAMRDLLSRLQAGEAIEKTSAPKKSDTASANAQAARINQALDLQFGQMRIQGRERINSLKAQLEAANRQLEEAAADRDKIMKDLAALQTRIGRLPIREQELAVVRRDYEISRANYQSLLDKGLSAEMAAEMERRQKAERFTTIDTARVPQKPVKPNRPLLYSAATLLSLLLGVAAALGRESQRDRILGDWELPKGVAVLGRVPVIAPYEPRSHTGVPGKPRVRRLVWVALAVLILIGVAAGTSAYFGWIQIPGVNTIHG